MEFINEPFVSYFVASDYVEVVCIKKYGIGLKTSKNENYGRKGITLEFQWKVSFLNGNLDEVHDGPLIAPLSREYRLVI